MFITETFAKEYIETYVNENKDIFLNKKLVIHTVSEMGIYLFELLNKLEIKVEYFTETNKKLIGKNVYNTSIIDIDNFNDKSEEFTILVSSPTTANKDLSYLISKGFKEENLIKFYPNVIDYFHDQFLIQDQEKYANLTREKNFELLEEERFKSWKVESLPNQIILDLTTKCNLNCCHCTDHHNIDVSRIRNQSENYLKMDRYNFLFKYVNSIYLNISGEPLLSDKFWDVLDYIDGLDNDPYLFTITNGLLLNEKASNRIVNSKFKMITISMDGVTPKTYKRLRRGGNFNVLIENLKRFVSIRNKAGRQDLEIRILSTVQRENLTEIPELVNLANEIGVDRLEIHPLYENIAGKDTWIIEVDDFVYYYPQQDIKYYPKLTRQMIQSGIENARDTKLNFVISPRFDFYYKEDIDDIQYPISIDEFKNEALKFDGKEENMDVEVIDIDDIEYGELCFNPWNMAMIFLNGNMMYCNRMNQPQGNINFTSFADYWNSEDVQNIRRGLINRDLSWDCYYCSGCDYGDAVKRIRREEVYFGLGDEFLFDINKSDSLREIEYKGISRIQRFGAWNNERSSLIKFGIDRHRIPNNIVINSEAFVIPGLVEEQKVNVYINDIYITCLEYRDNLLCDREIPIDHECIKDNVLTLKLEYLNAVSPISIGIGRDDRERALFIRKISLK